MVVGVGAWHLGDIGEGQHLPGLREIFCGLVSCLGAFWICSVCPLTQIGVLALIWWTLLACAGTWGSPCDLLLFMGVLQVPLRCELCGFGSVEFRALGRLCACTALVLLILLVLELVYPFFLLSLLLLLIFVGIWAPVPCSSILFISISLSLRISSLDWSEVSPFFFPGSFSLWAPVLCQIFLNHTCICIFF